MTLQTNLQKKTNEKIAVIGLGYVGLPVAIEFAKFYETVIGFDINTNRIEGLKSGIDITGEITKNDLKQTSLQFTNNAENLKNANFYIVTVPTPIDKQKRPYLEPLRRACLSISPYLTKGDVIVFESTVYPGMTEEKCALWLEVKTELKGGVDFKLGYSPERINPGDKIHAFNRITKVVAGQDTETLNRISDAYQTCIQADIFKAKSIKVAEAAKVIENTQRDLNIALMNELSLIFNRLDINIYDVLEAAGTKWNFLPFTPGLVGGHCIGVDPYYLTAKAEEVGYNPKVILAGRHINDSIASHIVQRLIKSMIQQDINIKKANIAILGLTFKENVPDIRNTKVVDIIYELQSYGANILIHDPFADATETVTEYDLSLCSENDLQNLDALIVAVPHDFYKQGFVDKVHITLKDNAIFIDLKNAFKHIPAPKNGLKWTF